MGEPNPTYIKGGADASFFGIRALKFLGYNFELFFLSDLLFLIRLLAQLTRTITPMCRTETNK